MVRVLTLTKRLLSMVCTIGLAAPLLLIAPAALADAILINNGLAPPNPANVIDDTTYSADRLRIRNVGCPPGGPSVDPDDPCPSPGAPTTVAVEDGAEMLALFGYDSSSILMNGGSATERARVFNSASFEITGGLIAGTVDAFDDSMITMSGGSVGALYGRGDSSIILMGGSTQPSAVPTLLVEGTSVMTIVGSNFAVDGVPVPYGDLTETGGVLTGTLLAGDALNSIFRQAGLTYTGTITLIPEPATAVLLGSGLIGLMALGRRRRAP